MSSNAIISLSSFNLLFFTQVLTVLTTTIKYDEYITDKGDNISIHCNTGGSIMWVKEHGNNSTVIQTGTFLVLTNVSEKDRGLYICLSTAPYPTSSQSTADVEITGSEKSDYSNDSSTVVNSSSSSTDLSPEITTSSMSSSLSAALSKRYFLQNSSRIEDEFHVYLKANLKVRTPPGPVTQLYFKASTILGFLIWRFNKTNSGGYPVRSFTAEYRNVSYNETTANREYEHEWTRMDPINIAPNVRQMEVYHLAPNTTYEFRVWANNQLGSGEIVTTNVTTLPETKEEDLIRLIQPDLDNFDPRIWILAVSIVLGTFVILAVGLCIVLSKECYQSSQHTEFSEGWDGIELIPNIILNPGFCDSDDQQDAPYTRTIIFGEDDESDGYDSEESIIEAPMERIKRKVSIFFTDPIIKRI